LGPHDEKFTWPRIQPLLKEKIPFLILAAASCLVTFIVQAQSRSVKFFLPLSLRLENAIVSYVSYLEKTVWPFGLSIFYPHPNTRYQVPLTESAHPASEQWPLWAILLATALLVGGSLLVLKWRRRQPWLLTGWFWYLGTLVPVIGLVQVGMQSMADRYTYIPLIGIFMAVVWSAAACAAFHASLRPIMSGTFLVILLACAFITRNQAAFWHDDLTLFQHALAVTQNNAMAESHVGVGLAKQGRFDLAENHFKAAIADDPYFYPAYSSLGSLYEIQGKSDQALEQYQTTLKMRPWDEFARLHLAELLHKLGRDSEALTAFKQNLQANPDSVEGNYQLGALLLDRGEMDSAAAYLTKTVALKPDHVDALLCLSDLRAKQGKPSAAQAALEEVVKLYPTNFELRINLAGLLWQGGKETEALEQYAEAVRLQPIAPIGHYDLAVAYAESGKLTESANQLAEAIRLKPDYVEALNELAWLLATNPNPGQRDGPRALSLSHRVLELGATNQPRTWAALDAAYAESGQFKEAIAAAEKARDLATAAGQTNAALAAAQRLGLYRNNQPFRLPQSGPAAPVDK
jgi:tetratricopeptide (TPR) repeat protein